MDYSKLYLGVALHGAEVGTDELGELYNRFVTWHTATDGVPTHASIKGRDFKGKVVGFKRQHTRLIKSGFSEVYEFHLYTSLPGAEYPNAQWSIYSYASTSGEGKEIVICASSSHVDVDIKGSFAKLVQSVIKLSNPKYGYGFYRDRGRGGGAEFYAIGLPTYISDPTPAEQEEQLSIQWWGVHCERRRLYDKGVLRDVYPWNFLNHKQLTRRIESQTLEEWISADASRGQLLSIDTPLTLWALSDEQIATIRPTLRDAGVLFNWRDYQ